MIDRLYALTYFLLFTAVLSSCTSDTTTSGFDPGSEIAEIRQVLDRQVDDWNAGNIERFMSGYIQSDSLRFVSGGSVRTGWSETLERYRSSYPDRDAMGTLSFDDIDVRLLSSSSALVFGRFRLLRTGDYTDATGLFTLILQKQTQGWRIIHDHTSAD